MGRFLFCVVALLAAVAPVTVRAQPVPVLPGYAINPPASDSPLQQQILRNYRSELRHAQRELAIRNPPGLSREQLDLTRQLNAVNSALRPASPSSVTTPSAPEPTPFR
jgi:hypothetical protein